MGIHRLPDGIVTGPTLRTAHATARSDGESAETADSTAPLIARPDCDRPCAEDSGHYSTIDCPTGRSANDPPPLGFGVAGESTRIGKSREPRI